MKTPKISRLLWLALGLTVFGHSTNMAQAQNDLVVSATSVSSSTVNGATNVPISYPYGSKTETDGSSTLNWTTGQVSSASSSLSTSTT